MRQLLKECMKGYGIEIEIEMDLEDKKADHPTPT